MNSSDRHAKLSQAYAELLMHILIIKIQGIVIHESPSWSMI